jgi:hypothetical protein
MLGAANPNIAGEPQGWRHKRRLKKLTKEIAQIDPVARYKYDNLSDVVQVLDRQREELLAAIGKAEKPGELGAAWRDSIPGLVEQLSVAYGDLREIATSLRFIRTRDRARVTIPIIVTLAVIAIAAMIPFIIVTQPGFAGPIASPVGTATGVKVTFLVGRDAAASKDGCLPTDSTKATAVGGTWTRPVLIFESQKQEGKCQLGTTWKWSPKTESEVILVPITTTR